MCEIIQFPRSNVRTEQVSNASTLTARIKMVRMFFLEHAQREYKSQFSQQNLEWALYDFFRWYDAQ